MDSIPREHAALADENLRGFANFDPAISDSIMQQLEHNASSFLRKQQRRLCLFACSKSAKTLGQLSIDEPETYDEIIELIEAYKLHLGQLLDLAEHARSRMKQADLRDSTTS